MPIHSLTLHRGRPAIIRATLGLTDRKAEFPHQPFALGKTAAG